MTSLILASTSVYRQQLLKKLGIPFTAERPPYDEDTAKQQALGRRLEPVQVAEWLSKGKGQSLKDAKKETGLVIISGDQLVDFGGEIIGKSHSFENAFQQLHRMKNRTHRLITAVTLITDHEVRHLNHVTELKMKDLTDGEIAAYLHRDEPYDCAGSYKIEESGIALFSEIVTTDFTAIQGLPLLWISTQLKELGYELFKK